MSEPGKKGKNPVLWLVVGLPLLSIVAGVSLVVIAVRSGGADVVRDDVRRVSQIQMTDIGPDEAARTRNLSAVLRTDAQLIELIPVSGDFDRKSPLTVILQHPAQAREDIQVTLQPGEGLWRAEVTTDDSHDWIVQLTPADGAWRLHGRLPKRQHATRLAPSIAQP